MKLGMAFSLLTLLLGCAATLRADEGTEDAKLVTYFKTYLAELFEQEPLTATALGDHSYDDKLDDISQPARDRNLERDKQALAGLPRAVDFDKLSRDGQIDYEIFRHHLTRSIWLTEHFDPFADDPMVYNGYLTNSVYMPLAQSSLPREQNLKNVLKRMELIPPLVKVARATIGTPPKIKTETAIRQAKGAISFYKDEIYTLADRPKGEGEIAAKAGPILSALEDHLKFLQDEVLPRSDDSWRIGKDLFAEKLELELNSGLTADEVLREAESEAARVEHDMALIARALWSGMFPGEPVPPDDEAGRRELTRRVLAEIGKDHGTPEGLVSDARATVDEIKSFINDRKILRLPEPDRLRIVEMPEFKRGFSVAYLDSAPPLDPAGSSEYAISPPPSDWTADQRESFLREYNRAMLKILTIHEAYPGHYVQLEYSNTCPSLIRKVLSSGTFAEGWAVYTEQMMLDQGFGGGDLKLRLQQLKFYLRAVVNAILDRKMHCDGMTDAEAMDLLVNRAFQTEGEALGKVARAKLSSTQLSTYFVGRTAFYRLRQSIQRERGDAFNLDRYHEAVLSHGTLPVKYLPELVRRTLGMEKE